MGVFKTKKEFLKQADATNHQFKNFGGTFQCNDKKSKEKYKEVLDNPEKLFGECSRLNKLGITPKEILPIEKMKLAISAYNREQVRKTNKILYQILFKDVKTNRTERGARN
jgi:hypothetical protein